MPHSILLHWRFLSSLVISGSTSGESSMVDQSTTDETTHEYSGTASRSRLADIARSFRKLDIVGFGGPLGAGVFFLV